jgi:polyphosphate:AMP phosphotransferase
MPPDKELLMFESAELGHKIDKDTYRKEVPSLREALLETQLDLLESQEFPVIVLIAGMDGAGKGETVNKINEWMDPRHIDTYAFGPPSDEEAERPPMWRYWRALPPKGKIGIYFGSWYTDPILKRAEGKMKNEALEEALEKIVHFEQMLIDEGALVLKYWFHLSKEKQKERMKKLEDDPLTRWRITDQDREHLKIYDELRSVAEDALRETSTAGAPWVVVESFDAKYRNLTVGKHIQQAIRDRLDEKPAQTGTLNAPPLKVAIDSTNLLSQLDLTKHLEDEEYDKKLERYQGKLNKLTRDPKFARMSVVCVFEGADAAGKGGCIRRITEAVDARHFRVIPIAAPTEEERTQPYLWRFWRQIPRLGNVTIFDRSWYGRVLVERVENFCSEYDWMRAYGEINDFEEQLAHHNFLVVKFWLQISKEEQLQRFEARQNTPYKRFKITKEDWRNRDKWEAYEAAACDMIDRTSTDYAPWTVVEANDKNFARIEVLKTLCERIEKAL